MRGHDPLISMRLRGCKPRSVWISLLPVQSWVTEWDKHEATQGDCSIELSPADIASAARLDLRFLVGLEYVIVAGPNDESTTRIAEACKEAGAKRVIAAYTDDSKSWFPLERVTDTLRETVNG